MNKITILYIHVSFFIFFINVINCYKYTDCDYYNLYSKTKKIIESDKKNYKIINCINKYGNKIFKNNEESNNYFNKNKRSNCKKLTNLASINRTKDLNNLYSCLRSL